MPRVSTGIHSAILVLAAEVLKRVAGRLGVDHQIRLRYGNTGVAGAVLGR